MNEQGMNTAGVAGEKWSLHHDGWTGRDGLATVGHWYCFESPDDMAVLVARLNALESRLARAEAQVGTLRDELAAVKGERERARDAEMDAFKAVIDNLRKLERGEEVLIATFTAEAVNELRLRAARAEALAGLAQEVREHMDEIDDMGEDWFLLTKWCDRVDAAESGEKPHE